MRVATIALILLAGCQQPSAKESHRDEAVESDDNTISPRAEAPTGSTSSLRAQTSPLTGEITGFSVEVTETATSVALAADTLFAFDRADLSAGALSNLQKTADLVSKGTPGIVTVIGHTDSKGTDDYNLDLSRRRAEAVASWLQAQPQLTGRRFEAVGRGSAEPVAPNTTPDGDDDPVGRARNRRVIVSIPRA
jgi:outer membrane protein OmpA-like peptidoglycan-associated protein